jgi:hypothetical protein
VFHIELVSQTATGTVAAFPLSTCFSAFCDDLTSGYGGKLGKSHRFYNYRFSFVLLDFEMSCCQSLEFDYPVA